MDHVERFTLERAWTDLTDETFFWEATSSTWSVRRTSDIRTATPFGLGDWRVDFEFPEPLPIPMTSIAWLAWHVGSMPARLVELDFFGGEHTMASGWTSPYLTHHPIFTNARDASSAFRDGWSSLRDALTKTTDGQFAARSSGYTYASAPMADGLCVLGPPGPERPLTFFVAGLLSEVSHHATQMCTLRDLYEHRAG